MNKEQVKKLIKDLIAKAQGDSGEVEEAADAMAAAKLED